MLELQALFCFYFLAILLSWTPFECKWRKGGGEEEMFCMLVYGITSYFITWMD